MARRPSRRTFASVKNTINSYTMKISKCLAAAAAALALSFTAGAADTVRVLDALDLTMPGLEKVAELHAAGNDSAAAVELLNYYRARKGFDTGGVNPDKVKVSKTDRKWADDAMEHTFFVHKGYQPSFNYGKDINWKYWPVQDNELRWQLHRTKWWVPMGKVYRQTGDEKYAAEWVLQYRDWIAKNPLIEAKTKAERKANADIIENMRFAWRPLEVADRLEHQIEQFALFLPSEHFTPEFLIEFLDNYDRHGRYLNTHLSKQGNHLLFEAQRMLYAGCYFPELKYAKELRRSGIDVLNREIKKQVFDDGVQFELDPGYHVATIGIFTKAMEMANANGYKGEFPEEYVNTIRNMIEANYNWSFPDYTQPVFSDNKLHEKKTALTNYRKWRRIFPGDEVIEWFASEGAKGHAPAYTSSAMPQGGFYTLRSGWDPAATVMVFKAGPKGEWHNQYDNGTFELWHAGRNYFPDSGSFIYGGDKGVTEQRNWFRQTRVHNTLTLDRKNLETRESRLLKWEPGESVDAVAVETPGYTGLTHSRAVWFVDDKFYVIADEAFGPATGDVAISYHMLQCEPAEDFKAHAVSTAFTDNNNLTLRVFGADKMERTEGWASPAYREKYERPSYDFSKAKSGDAPVRFITVIMPTDDNKASSHKIEAKYKGGFSDSGVAVEVKIDGKKYPLSINF